METTASTQNTSVKQTSNKSSIFKLILILAILIALGIGGYFAYAFVLYPKLHPYANLIPQTLKAYDLGKNADGFFVYKKDKELEGLFNQQIQTQPANMLSAAVGYFSSADQSVAVIAEFISKETAQLVTTQINTKNTTPGAINLFPAFNAEQKDNIVIITLGKGLSTFQGSLTENPDVKNIDPAKVDSQFIAFLNHEKIPEAKLLMYPIINTILSNTAVSISMTPQNSNAFIPVAHAQSSGFFSPTDTSTSATTANEQNTAERTSMLKLGTSVITFAQNSIMIINYKNHSLHAEINTNLIAKEDIQNSSMVTLIEKTNNAEAQTVITNLQKTYDDGMNEIPNVLPKIQEEAKKLKTTLPTSEVSINIDKKMLNAQITISPKDMQTLIDQAKTSTLSAPARARNAARKADVNSIVAAVETYNFDSNTYPPQSACIENIPGFPQYFSDSKLPTDTQGAQTFGEQTCKTGYYYQFVPQKDGFKDDGYIIWAKMENNLGTTNDTPENILKNHSDFDAYVSSLHKSTEGNYYAIVKTGAANRPTSNQNSPQKVKRPTTTTTTSSL